MLFITNLNPFLNVPLTRPGLAGTAAQAVVPTCPSTPLPDESAAVDLTPTHGKFSPFFTPIPTNLTLSHSYHSPLPDTPADTPDAMSMSCTTQSMINIWDWFLQEHVKGKNGSLHIADYYVVRAVSPYYMQRPTEPSAWFITVPGAAGRDNPSGTSKLTTGAPLRLEDISVSNHTHGLEFHVYHCVLEQPFLHQGGYTFYRTNHHVFTRDYIPCPGTPTSTIVAVPDYHTTYVGCNLSVQPNTFNQEMIPGFSNIANPPHQIWEEREEDEKLKKKFNWFSSSEDNIREEVKRILDERKFKSG